MSEGIFATSAPTYRELGFWPRPVQPRTKACKLPGWQMPDSEIDEATLDSWIDQNGSDGIGLLLGSQFPDGTTLGALDIDDDLYIRVARVILNNPPSGRIGARGILFFVRILGGLSIRKFAIKSEGVAHPKHIGELLGRKHLVVIPPTIHPDTGKSYRWIGTPLHEVQYTDLPIVEV